MTSVLVLGAGPAGLIAARTAQLCGADVTIYSRKEKSVIYGAQWIQKYIDGVTSRADHGYIHFILTGTAENYAEKIFGDPKHGTGWGSHATDPLKTGWDIRSCYDRLWDDLEGSIVSKDLFAQEMARIYFEDWDVIVNAIPLRKICASSYHKFDMYKVRISPPTRADHPYQGNRIIYNGRAEDVWFRESDVFGWNGGREYPFTSQFPGTKVIAKPQQTDCDCWKDAIRVGRYGRWDMHGLVHDGATRVLERLDGSRSN